MTAPYLHDGGVAMGKDLELGIPGTLLQGMELDPTESLRSLTICLDPRLF